MATLEIKSAELSIEVSYEGALLLQDNPRLLALTQHLRKMYAAAPLVSFTAEETPAGSKSFLYKIIAKDGREWTQTIKIVSQDPEMNFDVDDFWRLSEFILQRPIRDEFAALVSEHGITKIEVTW